MKRLVIEDIGKPGDPLRFAIEELTPITYPVLGFHVGDKVWLPVEQRLVERSPLFLWALGEHIESCICIRLLNC